MIIPSNSPDEYVEKIEDTDKQQAIIKLRKLIKQSLPPGFEEGMSYGMIGYYVPHELYPAGYHCDPKLPLPFVSIAAQKNFVAIYHMGVYARPELLDWFVSEHNNRSQHKLDMGKSCIRYKKSEYIPFDLIGELMQKMTPDQWIETYETEFKKSKK
jgi:hypothetical protein